MNKEEYIKKCGAGSARSLTADQIIAYFTAGYGGTENRYSATLVKAGRAFGVEIDRAKAVAMLRQAFEQGKELQIIFIEAEGVLCEGVDLGVCHFEMHLVERETSSKG